jgi:hypothetical protein
MLTRSKDRQIHPKQCPNDRALQAYWRLDHRYRCQLLLRIRPKPNKEIEVTDIATTKAE